MVHMTSARRKSIVPGWERILTPFLAGDGALRRPHAKRRLHKKHPSAQAANAGPH
jgi:hypothetical protein